MSYLRIKSYNVLNYNNCSTDWSFPLTFPTNGNPTLSAFIFHICIWSQVVPVVLKVFHFDHKASLLLCKYRRLRIPINLYFVILTTQGTCYYVSFSSLFSVGCLLPYYLKSIFVELILFNCFRLCRLVVKNKISNYFGLR
jgi:hypothetical protein